MATKMGMKEKYQINDATWQKLRKMYMISILLSSPFLAVAFTFMTWPVIDSLVKGYSWILFPVLPWAILYLAALLMHNLFFKRSKYSVFIRFLFVTLIVYFFAVLSNACVFRLFSKTGLVINSTFVLFAGVIFFLKYYKYWDKVWNSHRFYNENMAIDQKNARYDYLNEFKIDESKMLKDTGRGFSNAALLSLIYLIAPIGVGIGLVFSKFGMYTILAIIGWIGSIYTVIGFTKGIAIHFYNYRKLSYFEKKLGKPIVNGLLE